MRALVMFFALAAPASACNFSTPVEVGWVTVDRDGHQHVTWVAVPTMRWPSPPLPSPEELARTHGWIAPAVHDEAPASEEARRLTLDVAIARLRASHPARARRGRRRRAPARVR
jgi:hypothetical protein